MLEFARIMKLLHIIGARPQFVKAAMVSKAWAGHGGEFFIHTGQHYDENMSRLFFDELKLKEPDVNLGIGSATHSEQTAQMLSGIGKILVRENPDIVLVYGDTNSTLAGAIAAVKENTTLAHVEAGLRSYNRRMPEEINRVLTDHISDLLFCPTTQAVRNLEREGMLQGVYFVGDVMADSLKFFAEEAETRSDILEELGLDPQAYALVTLHRSGNVDRKHKLASIFKELAKIDFRLVFPVHPRTLKMALEFNLDFPENVQVIEPVGYLDMIMLEKNAECILTDSGGVQKEAYLLGVRCITIRDETEWVETVNAGWNCLAGADSGLIAKRFVDFQPHSDRPRIFGDGHASDKIIEVLNSSK